MVILIPKNLFLRVKDKFVADFIDNDPDVATIPSLLYKKIFAEAHATGKCTLPQTLLAKQCKLSVRALQHALRRLVELEYITVETVPGACNSYVLSLSDRVRALLSSHDIIDNPGWYPRTGKSSGLASQQPASTPSRQARCEDKPAHLIQEGGESGAYPSYNVYKNSKSFPPTPHSCPASGFTPFSTVGQEGGSFSAAPVKAKPGTSARQVYAREEGESAFTKLWAVWPVKKDHSRSLRIFQSLYRGGQLPPLDTLLGIVDNFTANDRHWRNGCAPLLSTWLRGKRWLDEPLVHEGQYSPAPVPSSGVQPAHAAALSALVENLPTSPAFEPALKNAVDTLAECWPGTSRTKIMASIGLARVRGMGFAQLAEKARHYVQETIQPRPIQDWLQGALA